MDSIRLSQRHITRHRIMERLIRRELTEKEASDLLGISVRHVRRIKRKVLLGGITSLIQKKELRSIEPLKKLLY